MRWNGYPALLPLVLGATGLLAQHAGAGAAHGAQAGSTPHLSSQAAAPRLSSPPSPALSNHAPGVGRSGHWPSWNGGNQARKEHPRYPYVYPGYLSFGYGLPVGYGFAPGGDSGDPGLPPAGPGPEDAASAPAPEPPAPQLAESAPPAYRQPYGGGQSSVQVPVHEQPATILVFKDGRPQQQVRNYALTASTLWALDGETRQEIPLATLDIPATIQANQQAGVDFALPTSR